MESITPFDKKRNSELTPYQAAREHYRCDHADYTRTEVRYKTYSNGTKHYFKQCLNCGAAVGSAIAHNLINHRISPNPWDERLENAYQFLIDEMQNKMQAERDRQFKNHLTDRQREYGEYLLSSIWQEKRKLVLKRDRYLCQACLLTRAQDVHHTTYDFEPGEEPLFVLVSVCRPCHNKLHNRGTDNE
jgi:5-methylcytosine-specific restriction endonuclease McrA